MGVLILTDSASDLSQEYAAEKGISVIPLRVRFGEEEFLDGKTIMPPAFFERLERKDVVPKTSQITPYEYMTIFGEAVNAGNEVVYISISSGVSGSWQNAKAASEEFPGKVFVVDSRQFCISEGIIAEEAARLRDEGLSAGEIAEKLEGMKGRAHVLSVFETLEYLKFGGRLSSAAAWVGGILSVKPVITIEEGIVKVMGKARGMKNGTATIFKAIEKLGGIDWSLPVLLGYTGISDERMQKFIEEGIELYGEKIRKLPIARVGAVIGTYAGPGAVAIAFFEQAGEEQK